MNLTNILIIYFIIINAAAFIIFGIDKRRAVKNRWRIAESTLFLLALIGGSIGALAGMYVFHHKTKHIRFVTRNPAHSYSSNCCGLPDHEIYSENFLKGMIFRCSFKFFLSEPDILNQFGHIFRQGI